MFRRNIIKVLESLPDCHCTHTEAPVSAPGVPDLEIYYRGDDFFVELKALSVGSRPPRLRPTQIRWAKTRAEAGGVSFVWMIDREVVYVFNATDIEGTIYQEDAIFHFQDGLYTSALILMKLAMENK